MRYILLLVTVAIIYMVFTRMVSQSHDEKTEVTQALNVANPPASGAAGTSPAPTPADSLKAPLDRTRAVLDQVRKQKAGEQF
jgi:hypothetical protein